MNKTILIILCLFGSIVFVNGESYSDTVSNIHPSATSSSISWVHTIPSNCTNITSLTIKIRAYDVDNSDYIPVSINGIHIGYLNVCGASLGTTTLTPDSDTLKQISDTNLSSLTVEVNPGGEYMEIDTSELTIEYESDDGGTTVKTPIPFIAIILTIAFMSSIIYYKIK